MKLFSEVEKTRIAYHADQFQKTVHRSSLLVPRFEHAATVISFLNHFLIKRNYKSVTLKITAISCEGKFKNSVSIEINKPVVYTFYLDELFQESADTGVYLVEFFSTENLFIPFPAVMINHLGNDFINTVHAYNRVLNDIFEDDEVNSIQISESSIDIEVDSEYDSFFNIASGPFEINGTLRVSLEDSEQITRVVPINMERMSVRTHNLSKIFDRSSMRGMTLKILQPKQPLFYGRLLAGVMNRKTSAFSANHSYYDTSSVPEYFDNNESSRRYPYFSDQQNTITMYPIVSKSLLEISVEISNDTKTFKSDFQKLLSPSTNPITFDINKLVKMSELENVSSFKVCAYSSQSKIPTRLSHQVRYSALGLKSKLSSSINIALNNEEVFASPNRNRMIWGQVVNANDYESRLGICFSNNSSPDEKITIDFYGKSGPLKCITSYLDSTSSLIFDTTFFARFGWENDFVWYVARAEKSELTAISFHYHRISENASGEHSF